jgi:hypothetical protein
MDWSWGVQLLFACGLLFVLVGVLWPKLKAEESGRATISSGQPSTPVVLPINVSQVGYAQRVRGSYRKLFGRWTRPSGPVDLPATEAKVNPQKAA